MVTGYIFVDIVRDESVGTVTFAFVSRDWYRTLQTYQNHDQAEAACFSRMVLSFTVI